MLKYSLFTLVGYLIPFIILISAKYFKFASFSYWDCIFIELVSIGKVCFFLIVIKCRRQFTRTFVHATYILQFIGWLAINAYLISWMNEIRFFDLFFCIIALIFLITQAELILALAIAILSSIEYIAVSYYAITYLNQSGDFHRELFLASSFGLITIFVALMSGMVKKQKENLKKSKIEIEHAHAIIKEKNKLLVEELKLAGEIQTSLLPQDIPEFLEAKTTYKYIPMMGVGGDFIDICISDDKNKIGFFICDVSGHGVAAAFVASMVKMALKNWHQQLTSPAVILESIYFSLKDKLKDNFVTASVCSVDFKNEKIKLVSAGHPPLIIHRHNGPIDIIEAKGSVISPLMKSEYQEVEIDIQKGDTIFLYTDGITEVMNSNREMFGKERFIEEIMNSDESNIDHLCNSILDVLRKFADKEDFDDDITLLAMKYIGS